MMQRKVTWLMSAVAAVSIVGIGPSAFGQIRVDTGNVRDANNRVGSGGSNGSQSRWGTSVSPNDIVYGNVTGGREFRGRHTSDPLSFRGNLAGSGVSGFIAGSSGAPVGILAAQANNAQNVSKYYDPTARGVNAPAGFIQQGPNAGYVPAPPPNRASGDLRLGAVQYDDSISAPRPGELMLPGAVSTADPNSMVTASPLYGVREWNRGDDRSFLSDNTFGSLNDQALDDQTLQQFRAELEVPAMPTANLAEKARVNAGVGTLDNANQSTPNLAQPPGTPLGQPKDEPLPSGQLPGENLATGNLAGGQLQTNQGTQQKLLSTPAQQSSQYQLMEDQMKSFLGNQGYQARQANKEYNAAVQRQKELDAQKNAARGAPAPAPGAPGGNAPGGNAPGGVQGGAPVAPTPKSGAPAGGENAPPPALGPTLQKTETPKPVQVHSLAEGIKAQGLKQLLTQAEDQMHQGKWISAIETYQNAVRVAPNQPLVMIGRANAELGATYYARAEDDLRQAFLTDKNLLRGQYDLRKMIGDDRLSYLLTDLKEMNQKEPKKSTSVFLLAYIAYNTGNEEQAAGYLDLLEQREKDPTLVKTLRQFWNLPGQDKNAPAGASQTDNLNK
jgi:hypothetical protein